MATIDCFGQELQRVPPLWAEPHWADTLRENRDEGGKGRGRGRREREEEGRRGGRKGRRRKREEKEKEK